jgi:hypothetical protein
MITRSVFPRFPRTALAGAAAAAAAAAAACATAGPRDPADASPAMARLLSATTREFRHDRVAPARTSATAIGTDQLSAEPDRVLYDIVLRTWPRLLRPGPTSIMHQDPRGDVLGVYTRAGFLGGPDVLRTVPARDVLAVYRLTPAEAYARYGRSHLGGAVEIVWRPAGS